MEKSKVFFTNLHTTPSSNLLDKMERLIKRAGIETIDFKDQFCSYKNPLRGTGQPWPTCGPTMPPDWPICSVRGVPNPSSPTAIRSTRADVPMP